MVEDEMPSTSAIPDDEMPSTSAVIPENQKDLDTIQNVESLLLGFANGNNATLMSAALNAYLEEDFDLERLKVQLLMIPDVIRTAFSGTKTTNKSYQYKNHFGCYE
jgi:hypothetical protein